MALEPVATVGIKGIGGPVGTGAAEVTVTPPGIDVPIRKGRVGRGGTAGGTTLARLVSGAASASAVAAVLVGDAAVGVTPLMRVGVAVGAAAATRLAVAA